MNERIVDLNTKIDAMASQFARALDLTEKKQYVLIQQINALRLERDQLVDDRDDCKEESEELPQPNTRFASRAMPRPLHSPQKDFESEDEVVQEEQKEEELPPQQIEMNDTSENRLARLLMLTQRLMDDNGEEEAMKRLLEAT